MPLVGIVCQGLRRDLVAESPRVSIRRLDFDDVGTEVGQDHGGAGSRNVGREVHDLESGKNVVACHWMSPESCAWRRSLHRPWNWGARFSRKADVPSFLSS